MSIPIVHYGCRVAMLACHYHLFLLRDRHADRGWALLPGDRILRSRLSGHPRQADDQIGLRERRSRLGPLLLKRELYTNDVRSGGKVKVDLEVVVVVVVVVVVERSES
jgi:hypothetical protein